jgi:TatD DNase family protein
LQYYDIHAHLADERLAGRLPGILDRCRAVGMAGILANAARRRDWPIIARLAREEPGLLRGALGLHPFYLDEWDDALPPCLARELRTAPGQLRAVGEIGLDFLPATIARCPRELQLRAFAAQLAVAVELQLPAILHCRKAWDELFAIWNRQAAGRIPGVLHCFGGGRDLARRALDLGFHLSFGGTLTWPDARRAREAAAFAPTNRLLTETDTPDLPAEPWRGGESEPWHVRAVLAELARLHAIPEPELAATIAAAWAALLDHGAPEPRRP